MTLGTLSWVYKPSDYLMVIGPGSPCWSYQSQDLRPAKTARRPATVETGAYWTGWAIIVFFTTDGTRDQNQLRLPVSAPYISVNNAKLHSVAVHRATGQVMAPDPSSRAQGRQTHSQVKAM